LISEQVTTKFSDYGFEEGILRDVAELGFLHPTPIQAQCIPPVLEGKDVIGLAQTGTGKTAVFGLPIIQRAARKIEMSALILAPTRELAQQIAQALRQLGKSSGIRVAVLVGGVPIKEDYKALRTWPNVLVATPGRLNDHIQSRTIVLSGIEILVVDEADRMYDMGFMPQIDRIVAALPKKRQTLMFTATMPAEVEKLVRRHMQSPVRIQVGLTAPPARAEQKLYQVQETDKLPLLLDLLKRSKGRVLVFVRTKRKVERLTRFVAASQHRVARIHGDREQPQRDAAMAGFRDGRYRILIATDIAARGIDVADIEHVINYDFPACAEDYIHRIGRTARVASSGLASSFVTNTERPCLSQLERLISAKLSLTQVGSAARDRRSETFASAGPNPRRSQPSAAGSGPNPRRSQPSAASSGPNPRRSQPSAAGSGPNFRRSQPSAAGSGPNSRRSQPFAAGSGPNPRRSQPSAAGSGPNSQRSQPFAAGSDANFRRSRPGSRQRRAARPAAHHSEKTD
jgi:ATP-dependent RNA helicase RhlE